LKVQGLQVRRKGKIRAWRAACSVARTAAGVVPPAATLQIVNVTTALAGILTDAFRREAGYQ
jgi:hypothetical protein